MLFAGLESQPSILLSFNEKVVQSPQSDMLLCTDTFMGCFLFTNKFLGNDSI